MTFFGFNPTTVSVKVSGNFDCSKMLLLLLLWMTDFNGTSD